MPTKVPDEHRLRPPGAMELDPSGEGVAVDETARLIGSNKVEGALVFNARAEELGVIHNIMLDKRTGQIAYVVMLCGGFLGLGGSHHPLPWRALSYDPDLGGYVVHGDDERLMRAPRYSASEDPFADPDFASRVDAHWSPGAPRAAE